MPKASNMPLSFTPFTVPSSEASYTAGAPQNLQTQLIFVGSSIYYVTRADISSARNLFIKKSTDGGTTWATVVNDGTRLQSSCVAVLVGTKIYIAINTSATALQFYVFDTATDTMAANSATGPVQGATGFVSACVMNDGRISVAYQDNAGSSVPKQVFYTPGTDTWGAAQSIPFVSVHTHILLTSCHDSVSDRVFFFGGDFLNPAPNFFLQCVGMTGAGAMQTAQNIATLSTNGQPSGNQNWAVGNAAVSGTSIFIPYMDPSNFPVLGPNPGVLKVARATVADNPVFSLDTLDTVPEYPALDLTTFDARGNIAPVASVVDLSGVPYVFYIIDNGDLGGATSESWIYYQSYSGGGVWSGRTLAYDAVVPAEMTTPFPAVDGSGNLGVLVNKLAPTNTGFFSPQPINGLTTVLLYSAAAPVVSGPPSKSFIDVRLAGPITLPDPAKICLPDGNPEPCRTVCGPVQIASKSIVWQQSTHETYR